MLALTALVGVAVAGLLVWARTQDPPGRRWVELVAFTPVGLPVAAVAVLASLLLVRRARRLGLLVLVVAVALTGVHGWWLAPRFTGAVPEAAPDGPRLVVMSQNLEQGDPAALVALVERREVDLLVLTDAPRDMVQAVVDAGLGRTLPHDTVAAGSGSVVWSRYPIRSDSPISDGGDSRVVTLDVPGLQQVDVVALHPTPPYQSDGARWQQDWQQVTERLRASYGPGVAGHVVVAGDLNATLDHWPLRSLEDLGFRDAAEQLNAGLAGTWPANGERRLLGVPVPPVLGIDHVLTAPGLVPTDRLSTDAAGSDHLGVVVTVAATR